jgi:hypothetical protein
MYFNLLFKKIDFIYLNHGSNKTGKATTITFLGSLKVTFLFRCIYEVHNCLALLDLNQGNWFRISLFRLLWEEA